MFRHRDPIGNLFVKGYWGVAGSLALALVDDREKAIRITKRAFKKSFARLSHLRDPHEFEISLLGQVVRGARRRRRTAEVDLEATFFLEHVLEFPGPAVAEILDRTEHHARRLHTDAGSRPLLAPRLEPPGIAVESRLAKSVWAAPLATVALVCGVVVAILLVKPDPGPTSERPVVEVGALPEVLGRLQPRDEPIVAASGFAGGRRWLLRVYPAEQDTVCLELRVDEEFGDVHCLDGYPDTLRGFVAADSRRQMTFVFGYAAPEVKGLTIEERNSAPLNIELDDAPEAYRTIGPAQIFLVSLPDYLLQLVDREQGRSLGYQMHTLVLEATDARGDRVERTILHLGRPG